jgi:hypothetical protein
MGEIDYNIADLYFNKYGEQKTQDNDFDQMEYLLNMDELEKVRRLAINLELSPYNPVN